MRPNINGELFNRSMLDDILTDGESRAMLRAGLRAQFHALTYGPPVGMPAPSQEIDFRTTTWEDFGFQNPGGQSMLNNASVSSWSPRGYFRSAVNWVQSRATEFGNWLSSRRVPGTNRTFGQTANRIGRDIVSLRTAAAVHAQRAYQSFNDTVDIVVNAGRRTNAALVRTADRVTQTLITVKDTAVGIYNGLDRGAAGNRASFGNLLTSVRDGINYLDNNFSLEGYGNAIDQLRGLPVAPGAPSPVNVYNDIDNGLKAIDAWADRTDARILDYLGQAALFPDKIPSDIRSAFRSARDAVSDVYEAEGIPGLAERASYYGMRTAGEAALALAGTKGAGSVLRATPTAGGRTLSYQASSGVALTSVEGRTTTILGSYANDMQYVVGELGNVKSLDFGPRSGGFNVLNVPDSLYQTPRQFFDSYNGPWLQNAVVRNDNILMATRPRFDVRNASSGESVLLARDPTTNRLSLSGFGREYLSLRRAGYTYRDGRMVR